MTEDVESHGGAAGRILVDRSSEPVRRALDPTAWMVLEELALSVDSTGGAVAVAQTSVRRLAGALALSKDTVAAAIRRLMAADLVRRIDDRETASGRFGRSHYEVDLAAAGLVRPSGDNGTDAHGDHPRPASPATRTADVPAGANHRSDASRQRRHDPAQLSLLDPPAPSTPPTTTTDQCLSASADHAHRTAERAKPIGPDHHDQRTNTIATPRGLVPVPARRPSSEGGR